MSFFRRLTYRTEVVTLARWLGLRTFLRKLYFRWARPKSGVLNLELAGVTAQFYVRTPGELRNLDPAGRGQLEYPVMEKLASFLSSGGVFYDIGSNVGLYAILVAKKMGERGEVVAFEPYSEAYRHLKENVQLNGLKNVKAFRKAAGNSNGVAELHFGEENADSSLAQCPTGRDLGHERVDVVSVDDFIQAERLPLPRAVKIDVEGFEQSVIDGMRRTLAEPACELVCCEVHPRLHPPGVTPELVLDSLKSLGFKHLDARPRRDTFHVLGRKSDP
jgi:FkbM family methyltransferase